MVSWKEIVLMALQSLKNSLFRTLLTMLGIIIGVAAVISMTAVMNGTNLDDLQSEIDQGLEKVALDVENAPKSKTGIEVKPEDVYRFLEENKDLFSAASPSVDVSLGKARISHEDNYINKQLNPGLAGVGEGYLDASRRTLLAGRNLTYADVKGENMVCLLPKSFAMKLFGGVEQAVGRHVMAGDICFQVVGVISTVGVRNQDKEDTRLIIPYTACRVVLGDKKVGRYYFLLRDYEKMGEATIRLRDMVMEIRGDVKNVKFETKQDILQSLKKTAAGNNRTAVSIAAISLLIAGVGVMNVELVAVRQRTKEIGIRKSLGALNSRILAQFVFEAVFTSVFGGIFGILAGILIVWGINRFTGMRAEVVLWAVWLSLGISMTIGIFFGYLPAKRAASMKPIDALREEE